MPSLFIPRDREIRTLENQFSKGLRIGLVIGPAGIGKTTLVRLFLNDRFGYDFGHDLFPGGISYVYGYQSNTISEVMQKQLQLSMHKKALFVIDEAEMLPEAQITDIHNIIKKAPNLYCLLSTRDQYKFTNIGQFSITLGGFSQKAFNEYLHQYNLSITADEARAFWRLSAGNPLIASTACELIQGKQVNWEEVVHAFSGFTRPGVLGPDGTVVDLDSPTSLPIVSMVRAVNDNLLQTLSSDPNTLYSLSPRKFEEVVAELLIRQGYSVELTPTSGDGGVDIYVARRESFGEFLYLVECKKYTPPHKVGVEIVRSLYGVVQQQNANGGIIVTTSFFTAGAQDFQKTRRYQIHLRDFFSLQPWLSKFNQS